jgi:hypothetical protein
VEEGAAARVVEGEQIEALYLPSSSKGCGRGGCHSSARPIYETIFCAQNMFRRYE